MASFEEGLQACILRTKQLEHQLASLSESRAFTGTIRGKFQIR